MSPVRNPATGFDIRASSFLRHWSFRHSSFSSAWDTDNQLSAKTHDGQALGTASYLYDVLGRRVGKDSGGGSSGKIVTLWWDMREVADYESSGTNPAPIHHYLNLPRHNDRLARTVQSGNNEEVQYYHKNYLDHVYAITDEDGKALEYIRYTAFGLPTYYNQNGIKVATSPTGNQFTWNGKRLDPRLGWYVYHYRHYSPEMGRWTSRDPIGEWGGLNLYGFLGNRPMIWWDFLGLELYDPGEGHMGEHTIREFIERQMAVRGGEIPADEAAQFALNIANIRDRGCIGLCDAFQSPDANPNVLHPGPIKPGRYPEDKPGTVCFLTEDEADEHGRENCAEDEEHFVFAIQGEWRNGDPPNVARGMPVPSNSILHNQGRFNYVSRVGDSYFSADAGALWTGVLPTIYDTPAPPALKDGWGQIWCVSCRPCRPKQAD